MMKGITRIAQAKFSGLVIKTGQEIMGSILINLDEKEIGWN